MHEPQQLTTPPTGTPCLVDTTSDLPPEAAYLAAFVGMRASLQAYLRALLPLPEDADDALQETFLVVCERLNTFDRSRDFGCWVRGIARNIAARKRRGHHRARVLPIEAVAEHEELAAGEQGTGAPVGTISGVRSWIARLGKEQQRIVMLRYVERLSIDAIARRLRKTPAAVYMALSRIRGSLAHEVERQSRLAAHGALGSGELPPTPADAADGTTIALRLLLSGDGLPVPGSLEAAAPAASAEPTPARGTATSSAAS